jgi:hypothetical protein
MHFRGQAATEYTILLAVTLMVGLAATALLTWSPGVGKDTRLHQSEAYWRAAQPFAVVAANTNSRGTLSLVVQNNGAESTVLKSIGIGGNSYYASSTLIGPGQTATVVIAAFLNSSTGLYDGLLSFTYDTVGMSNLVQSGARNFIVGCPTSFAGYGGIPCVALGSSGCSITGECCTGGNTTCDSGTCCIPDQMGPCTTSAQCCGEGGTCMPMSHTCTVIGEPEEPEEGGEI